MYQNNDILHKFRLYNLPDLHFRHLLQKFLLSDNRNMLPAMYLFGKQLTKRTDMAVAAMTIMALDCMHLTQTRIATIDSFPVLFIMLD